MCYTYRISEIIKRKKKMKDKRKKADWLTIIPILFWLSCMAFSLNDAYKNDFDILAYADMLFWIEQYNISRL